MMNKKFMVMALCVLCATLALLCKAEREKITFNGNDYDIGLVRAVVVSMGSLDKIICKELHQKAVNPEHKLYAVIAKVLKKHELIDENGNLKKGVSEIVKEYEKRRKDMGMLDFLRSSGNPFEFEKR